MEEQPAEAGIRPESQPEEEKQEVQHKPPLAERVALANAESESAHAVDSMPTSPSAVPDSRLRGRGRRGARGPVVNKTPHI